MKRKLTLTLLLCIPLSFILTGCETNEARQAKQDAIGKPHTVSMYSGGELVKQWKTNTEPERSEDSSSFYFMDSKTGKLVRVTGDVVVERQ